MVRFMLVSMLCCMTGQVFCMETGLMQVAGAVGTGIGKASFCVLSAPGTSILVAGSLCAGIGLVENSALEGFVAGVVVTGGFGLGTKAAIMRNQYIHQAFLLRLQNNFDAPENELQGELHAFLNRQETKIFKTVGVVLGGYVIKKLWDARK